MDLATTTTSYGAISSKSWIGDEATTQSPESCTLDLATFGAGLYPTGWVPSGTPLSRSVANAALFGPYSGTTDEVQTATVGGSGLTSFTLTYSGQTTASIDDAATAADVQAALVALSNLAPGDVTVTGAAGGPWTITFGGTLADTNVAAITSTPTGGSGTVTMATATAGGADGVADLGVLYGFLYEAIKVDHPTGKVGAAIITGGKIREANLPYPVDANGWTDVASRFQKTIG